MKLFNTLLFLCVIFSLNAQKAGKVTTEMLKQVSHPIEKDAPAANLFQKAEIIYKYVSNKGLALEMDYFYRIKIYDDEGVDKYGNFEIPYFEKGSQEDDIYSIKAVTYNLVNGEVVKTKMEKKDILTEKTTNYWRIKKIPMPEVRPGSIIELKYTMKSPFIYSIPNWFFQHYIPTDHSEYFLQVPDFLIVAPIPSGLLDVKASNDVESIFNVNYNNYHMVAKNVESIVEDEFVLSEDDFRSGIKYELSSVEIPGRLKEYLSKNWNEIANNLTNNESFGNQLNKKMIKGLNEVLKLVENMEPKERLNFIYDYIQTTYSWNEKYGIYTKGLRATASEKTGSVGDINLSLIYLLKNAGITVYPMVMKSRGSGVLNTSFPSVTELDYVIAYIEFDGEVILADATSKSVVLGKLPTRAVNVNGVIVNGDKGIVTNLKNPNQYKSQTMYKFEYDFEKNSLKGIGQRRLSEYAATKYRLNSENPKKEEEESSSEDEINIENTFKTIEVSGVDDIHKPITLKSDVEIVTATKGIGNKLFVDATFHFGLDKNYFTEPTRNYPVFYSYRIDRKDIVDLTIPEGYVLESAPEDVKIGLEGDKGIFTFEVKPQGENRLMIYHTLKIKNDIFLPGEYPSLKQFYEIMFKLTKEKIVFSKKG